MARFSHVVARSSRFCLVDKMHAMGYVYMPLRAAPLQRVILRFPPKTYSDFPLVFGGLYLSVFERVSLYLD